MNNSQMLNACRCCTMVWWYRESDAHVIGYTDKGKKGKAATEK